MGARESVKRRSSSIEIHIDELELEGFAPSERYDIAEAVQRELTRLFVEGESRTSPVEWTSRDTLDAGEFALKANARGEMIGAHIAQQVYGALSARDSAA